VPRDSLRQLLFAVENFVKAVETIPRADLSMLRQHRQTDIEKELSLSHRRESDQGSVSRTSRTTA
jgi:hypothetical protein